MDTQTRIRMIRLWEKINRNEEYAGRIGVEVINRKAHEQFSIEEWGKIQRVDVKNV